MKMRLFNLAIALALFVPFAGQINADIIVEWDGVSGSSVPADNITNGVSGTDLTRGSGISAVADENNRFSSNNVNTGDLNDAVVGDDFISFGFSTDISTTVSLDDIMIELDTEPLGPTDLALMSDITGFNALNPIEIRTMTVTGTGTLYTFDLSGNGNFQDFQGSVEFRIYFHGATNSTGEFHVGNDLIGGTSGNVGIQINGTSIPEPGSFGLFGLAAMAGLAWIRRKRA